MSEENKYYRDRIIPPQDFFDKVIESIPVYKWKNKSKTIIGSNRKSIKTIEKRLASNSVLDFNHDYLIKDIMLIDGDKIEFQSYGFKSKYIKGKEKLDVYLRNMDVFKKDAHTYVYLDYNWVTGKYQYTSTPGKKFLYYSPEYIGEWEDNLKKMAILKYLDLTVIDDYKLVFNFPRIIKYRSEIEFLQKIGAHQIAFEVMTAYADMRFISRKWLKKNKFLLKNNNSSFHYFELNEQLKLRNSKLIPGIEKYLKISDIKKLPQNINFTKFQNYLLKYNDFSYYLDYLNILKDLNIEPNSDSMWFPKDLTKAHDEAVKLLNQIRRKEDNKDYQKKVNKIIYLEGQIDNYIFKIPRKLNEIIQEGRNMHHCVGGSQYLENHKNLRSIIVFMRHADTPNESLYTIEFKRGKIIQHRGKYNANPTKEAIAAARKWLIAVNKKSRNKQQSTVRYLYETV